MQFVSCGIHNKLSQALNLVWGPASYMLCVYIVFCGHAFASSNCWRTEAAEAIGLNVSLIELFAGVQEVTLTFRSAGLPAAALDLSVDRKVCDLLTPAGMACRAFCFVCVSQHVLY